MMHAWGGKDFVPEIGLGEIPPCFPVFSYRYFQKKNDVAFIWIALTLESSSSYLTLLVGSQDSTIKWFPAYHSCHVDRRAFTIRHSDLCCRITEHGASSFHSSRYIAMSTALELFSPTARAKTLRFPFSVFFLSELREAAWWRRNWKMMRQSE